MGNFYDNNKLLNLLDENGNHPEIFISEGNRSAGKTISFNRYLVNNYIKKGNKFILLYRYGYEMDGVSDKFFDDIKTLFFQNMEMTEKKRAKGKYVELFIDEKTCGYAVSLNSAEFVKHAAHIFYDCEHILFDDFLTENDNYLPDEIKKFVSIHQSVARGGGKSSRYLPVYLIANRTSLLNPYYTSLGISSKIQNNTKICRGSGYVLERFINKSAKKAQDDSLFNQAFFDSDYHTINDGLLYLNDDITMVKKMSGNNYYMCTLRFNKKLYGIRRYENDIIYIDNSFDETYPLKIAVTQSDIDGEYIYKNVRQNIINLYRKYFNYGVFRFKNLDCKNAIMNLLTY